jgi:hypothetical protein
MDKKGIPMTRKFCLIFLVLVFGVSITGCQTCTQKSKDAAAGATKATKTKETGEAARKIWEAPEKADNWVRENLW